MGLFSPKSTSIITTTTQSWADSFNTTLSRSDVISDAGNTTINIGERAGAGALGSLPDWWPVVAIAGALLFAAAIMRRT